MKLQVANTNSMVAKQKELELISTVERQRLHIVRVQNLSKFKRAVQASISLRQEPMPSTSRAGTRPMRKLIS